MNPQSNLVNTPSSVATRSADFENVSRIKSSSQGVGQ